MVTFSTSYIQYRNFIIIYNISFLNLSFVLCEWPVFIR